MPYGMFLLYPKVGKSIQNRAEIAIFSQRTLSNRTFSKVYDLSRSSRFCGSCDPMCQIREVSALFGTLGNKPCRRRSFSEVSKLSWSSFEKVYWWLAFNTNIDLLEIWVDTCKHCWQKSDIIFWIYSRYLFTIPAIVNLALQGK